MVKMVWNFEVAREKQEEYLKATMERIKPYWESYGCLSYDVYQEAEGGGRFIKEQVFHDLPSMQKIMSLFDTDEEAKAVVNLFRSLVTNMSRKAYVKKI